MVLAATIRVMAQVVHMAQATPSRRRVTDMVEVLCMIIGLGMDHIIKSRSPKL